MKWYREVIKRIYIKKRQEHKFIIDFPAEYRLIRMGGTLRTE
jgi:hypothetical protein